MNHQVDWKNHFRAVDQLKRNQVSQFGTTLSGDYSIAELQELLKAKDVEMHMLLTDGTTYLPTWGAKDPAGYSAWQKDMDALTARWNTARAAAQAAISNASIFMPNNIQSADAEFKGILSALNPSWQAKTSAPGSLEDLRNRLAAAGMTMTKYTVPQPSKSSDASSLLIQSPTGFIAEEFTPDPKGVQALKDAIPPIPPIPPIGSWLPSKWEVIAGVGATLVGLVLVAKIVK